MSLLFIYNNKQVTCAPKPKVHICQWYDFVWCADRNLILVAFLWCCSAFESEFRGQQVFERLVLNKLRWCRLHLIWNLAGLWTTQIWRRGGIMIMLTSFRRWLLFLTRSLKRPVFRWNIQPGVAHPDVFYFCFLRLTCHRETVDSVGCVIMFKLGDGITWGVCWDAFVFHTYTVEAHVGVTGCQLCSGVVSNL